MLYDKYLKKVIDYKKEFQRRRIELFVFGSILLPAARSIITLSGASRHTIMNIKIIDNIEY
jgi:hypothetical protein